MGSAVIMNQEQADVLTSDLAELIGKIEKLNNSNYNDYDQLKKDIKIDIKNLFLDMRIKEQLKTENLELEDNLNELKRVKSHYMLCEKKGFIKTLLTILITCMVTIPVSIISTVYILKILP